VKNQSSLSEENCRLPLKYNAKIEKMTIIISFIICHQECADKAEGIFILTEKAAALNAVRVYE
jgi:hypothetical protein